MFKLLVFAAILAIAAAASIAPFVYSGYKAPYAYSAYSAAYPYGYSGFSGKYITPYAYGQYY